MITRNFILATAGHVDHGKSSLVKALTGIDPDRLPEEKARGITIDLGFAHLEISGVVEGQPAVFHLGIVDVPGHEDFVKNMVAGVGSVDLALLIVAADDGWMPQTEEHLQILSYLGVTRAVVALTKIDLAEDEGAVEARVREKLANSPLADAPIVPTSVISGRGLDELKAAVACVLSGTPPPRDIGKPRLPVDRVFMLRGIGMVVTGTLKDGQFRRGQNVIVQPSGRPARIRSVQNHNRDVESIGPGTRTALSLPDVKGAAGEAGIQRGDVITVPELGQAGKLLDVIMAKSARLTDLKTSAARPLKNGARVRVHFGSTDVPAHLFLLGTAALEAGGRCVAQLRFERPVFALIGDRLIVRDWSGQTTLAGGVVLDADPSREKFRGEPRRTFLEARANGDGDVNIFVSTEVERLRAFRTSELLVRSRFSAKEISESLDKLAAEKRVMVTGGWGLDAAWWERLRQNAAASIDAVHQAHPDHPGLPITELKALVQKELPAPEIFDVLTTQLCQGGFAQAGVAIRRKTHQLALPPQLQGAGAKVRQALSAKPLDPPSRKDVAPDASAQQALRFLLQTGEAVQLAEDVVMLTEGFQRATEMVKDLLRSRGSATPSDLRLALGTSRRILIPLLERLDRDGITRRDGEKRVLR